MPKDNVLTGVIKEVTDVRGNLTNGIEIKVTDNYEYLTHKPSINGTVLEGDISSEYLGIAKVLSFTSHYEFPNIGDSANLYISISDNTMFRWDDSNTKYYKIADGRDVEIINGGDAYGTANN